MDPLERLYQNYNVLSDAKEEISKVNSVLLIVVIRLFLF